MAKTKEERREVNKASQREWHKNNIEKARDHVRKRRIERREWFDKILETLKCCKCGQNHPATLDFHHRDPSTKVAEVSWLLGSLKSKESILEEIQKCDVYCANCHRIHHWEDRE